MGSSDSNPFLEKVIFEIYLFKCTHIANPRIASGTYSPGS